MSFVDEVVKGPDSREPQTITRPKQAPFVYQHKSFAEIAKETASHFRTGEQVLGTLILANQHRPDKQKSSIEELIKIAQSAVAARKAEINQKIQDYNDAFKRKDIDDRNAQRATSSEAIPELKVA